jgi:hypothetical protein
VSSEAAGTAEENRARDDLAERSSAAPLMIGESTAHLV